MSYVGNIVAFIQFLIEQKTTGYEAYNYVDKPDFTTNDLVYHTGDVLGKHIPTTHIPYWLGMLGLRHKKETDDQLRTREEVLCSHPI